MLKEGIQTLSLIKNKLYGANLKKLLKEKRITKWRLAKDTGITYRSILNWQNESNYPSDENTIMVAKYLGLITPDETELLAIKNELYDLLDRIKRIENK